MPHGSQDETPHGYFTHSIAFRLTMLLLALAVRFAGVAERTDNSIRFTSPHRYMIVVQVRVNGSGPYSFLLDTGATSSTIDPQLFTSLHLSAAKSVTLASWEETTDARRALVQSLSFGPVSSGPLAVLVQPLSEFKAFDSHLRGVLGQDVLLRCNYLIDNRHHRIEFDNDGAILQELTGDRVTIAPVSTLTGAVEPRLSAVLVQTAISAEPLHLLLDSGADMVVLQPHGIPPADLPRGRKWIADENGRLSSAATFRTRLAIGSESFAAEAWVGDTGLKQLVIDGLLPTGSFDELYIANRDSFVIIAPGHTKK